jgi:hypothetical protein
MAADPAEPPAVAEGVALGETRAELISPPADPVRDTQVVEEEESMRGLKHARA